MNTAGAEPRLHALLDVLAESILYLAICFSLWALGTTHDGTVWTMNALGYAAGAIWFCKLLVRRLAHWSPARWRQTRPSLIMRALACVTFFILGYTLISALNCRATFYPETWLFEYRDCLNWLPHSYDSLLTWQHFWNYLALALFFWSTRDWLLTRSSALHTPEITRGAIDPCLPPRLRRLLWVVSVNGALLAAEGFVQRQFTDHLLWFYEPSVNKTANLQFGPFAHRANAAQWLNLAWPVALGFWWSLCKCRSERRQVPGVATHLLAVCTALMMVAVLWTGSWTGTLVGVFLFGFCLPLFLFWPPQFGRLKWLLPVLLAFCITGWLAGPRFADTLHTARIEITSHRVSIWAISWRLFQDTPWFGTGPGTFDTVYQLAHGALPENWYAQLHNDWMETLITFGVVGFIPILAGLLLLPLKWAAGQGIGAPGVLALMFILAVAGCLLQAVVSFPLQVYSLLFLVVVFCAVISCLGKANADFRSGLFKPPVP